MSYFRFQNCGRSSRSSAGGGVAVGPGGEAVVTAAAFIHTQYIATIPLMALQ